MAILETAVSHRGGGAGSFALKKKVYLITLTVQNSALILIMHHSRLMKPTGDHRYFTSTAVFLTEVIKLAVSLTLAMYETSKTLAPSTPATVLFEQINNAIFSGDGWKLAVPAAFYTLQNMLQYVAVGNLDAVHFQVLYQLKILITALFSVFLLRRPLSLKRWVALVALTVGVSIVSLPTSDSHKSALLWNEMTDHFFPRSMHELGQVPSYDVAPDVHLTKRSATYEGIDADMPAPDLAMNYSVGVTSVLVAAAVSGLTGVFFEKILKESPSQASVWIRNVQLSFYSLVVAFVGGVMWQDGDGIREHGFFEGYNWVVWSTILLQAAGGMIGSLVIRDADNIVKNFATSISIVISFLVSVWMFEFTVTATFLIGTSLVLLSTYLYYVPEPLSRRPPPIHIASFEKPHIVAAITPKSTPRTTDSHRLNSDPFDAITRTGGAGGLSVKGLTTSRPSSPMLQRQPSRSNLRHED